MPKYAFIVGNNPTLSAEIQKRIKSYIDDKAHWTSTTIPSHTTKKVLVYYNESHVFLYSDNDNIAFLMRECTSVFDLRHLKRKEY